MKVALIDGWKHPLSEDDLNWELASEAIAMASERIPLGDTLTGAEPYNAQLSRRRRVIMRRCQCTLRDILAAKIDDVIYLSLIARYVPTYDELP